jgi:FkbM family methyltransferase
VGTEIAVFAIDATLGSLVETRRLTAAHDGRRLKLVHGLVGERPTASAANAHQETLVRLDALELEHLSAHYTCIGDEGTDDIPMYTLDDLVAHGAPGPMLIKVDVEGAELLVLRGARRILARADVALLLSVHPKEIGRYKTTIEDVRSYLAALGYSIDPFAWDHEQHWWCHR